VSDQATVIAAEVVKILPGALTFIANMTGSKSVGKASDIIGDLSDSRLVEWLTEYLTSLRTDVVEYSSGTLEISGPVTIEHGEDS